MHERSRELTKKNNLDDSSESEDSTVDVTSESESDSDGSLFAGSNSAESESEELSRKRFWWYSVRFISLKDFGTSGTVDFG